MRTIHKYPIAEFPAVTLHMPAGAEILKVAWQETSSQLCLWAVVETTKSLEARRFVMVGTGDAINKPKDLRYVETVFLRNGALVYHIFEVVPVEDL